MRCLYCGKQLALFKKLTGGGEFCSDAHKQKYHEEYNRLALNRLMEAQSRQEEQAPTRKLAETTSAAPETSAFAEPTARGDYFRQEVSARNAPLAAPPVDACGPVARAIEFPALAIEARGEPELPFAGLVVLRRVAYGGGQTAPPAPSEFPPLQAGTVALPESSSAQIRTEPELLEGAVIIDRRPRLGSNGTSLAALQGRIAIAVNGAAAAIALPECVLNPLGAASPEASGATEIDPFAIPRVEVELLCEPAVTFEYSCAIPANLDPGWASGLEFDPEGASPGQAGLPEAPAEEADVAPVLAVAEPESEPVAVSVAEATEAEPVAVSVAEAAKPEATEAAETGTQADEAIEVKAPEVLLGIAPATHEPVINEDVLRALFGGNDDAEPAAAPMPAAQAPPARAKETSPAPPSAPVAGAPAISKPPAAPKAAVSGSEAKVSQTLPFLEVSIRPAAPGKPRLMQTFQAISLVSATAQIPAWNMLPLRPRMSLGREPGPGAALLERSKAQNSPQTATEEPPEEGDSMDLPVPSFASAGKPKSGLSRWFKLGVIVGVLGLAGYGAGERAATNENPQHMSWSLQNAGNE